MIIPSYGEAGRVNDVQTPGLPMRLEPI